MMLCIHMLKCQFCSYLIFTSKCENMMNEMLQIHTGLQHGILSPCQDNGLPVEMPIIANKLHDAGYATHMVGKWHVGNCEKLMTPPYRGFDSYFGQQSYYTFTQHIHYKLGLLTLTTPYLNFAFLVFLHLCQPVFQSSSLNIHRTLPYHELCGLQWYFDVLYLSCSTCYLFKTIDSGCHSANQYGHYNHQAVCKCIFIKNSKSCITNVVYAFHLTA